MILNDKRIVRVCSKKFCKTELKKIFDRVFKKFPSAQTENDFRSLYSCAHKKKKEETIRSEKYGCC